MSRWMNVTTALGTILMGIAGTLGCSMGANPHDCKYAAYGGLMDRVDRVNGRVGSVIDPAVVVTHEPDEASLEPTLAEPPEEPPQEPEPVEPTDSPEPAEAHLDDGGEFLHVDQDGSMLELIETENTHDQSLYR